MSNYNLQNLEKNKCHKSSNSKRAKEGKLIHRQMQHRLLSKQCSDICQLIKINIHKIAYGSSYLDSTSKASPRPEN